MDNDASASGGWAWSPERKAAFTNDLEYPWHLNAVSGAENQRKADSGPDRWLPPETAFRDSVGAHRNSRLLLIESRG